MPARVITPEVRKGLSALTEPLPRILEALGRLRDFEGLRMVPPFEPHPLIGLLVAQGFTARKTPLGAGNIQIIFSAPICQESPVEALL